jgi:hypothetical protein
MDDPHQIDTVVATVIRDFFRDRSGEQTQIRAYVMLIVNEMLAQDVGWVCEALRNVLGMAGMPAPWGHGRSATALQRRDRRQGRQTCSQ